MCEREQGERGRAEREREREREGEREGERKIEGATERGGIEREVDR